MFWKKKKLPDPVDTLAEFDDQRAAYRYVFRPGQGISIKFKGKSVRVTDISAGGLAFINRGFKKYDTDTISVDLDIPNYPGDRRFTGQLRILHLNREGICHCIFENCTVDDYEFIHKYVLELQKQDLKNK